MPCYLHILSIPPSHPRLHVYFRHYYYYYYYCIRSYLNFAYAQPYQHALLHESLVLEVPRWDYDSRIEALLPLTVADLKAFQGVLLGRLKVREWMKCARDSRHKTLLWCSLQEMN